MLFALPNEFWTLPSWPGAPASYICELHRLFRLSRDWPQPKTSEP